MLQLGNTDKALVRRLLAGDDVAFQEFFTENFPRLYRFALSRLDHDADAAEEIVQATLCKVVRKLDTFRGEAALFTWMCTFCRHEISAWRRRSCRMPARVDLVEDIPEVRAALDSLAAIEDDPEQGLQRKEVSRLVQVTLDYLPPRYGNALEWKYIQGLSVKEISDRLQVSPKATESLLTRARQAFRDGFTAIAKGRPQWYLSSEAGC